MCTSRPFTSKNQNLHKHKAMVMKNQNLQKHKQHKRAPWTWVQEVSSDAGSECMSLCSADSESEPPYDDTGPYIEDITADDHCKCTEPCECKVLVPCSVPSPALISSGLVLIMVTGYKWHGLDHAPVEGTMAWDTMITDTLQANHLGHGPPLVAMNVLGNPRDDPALADRFYKHLGSNPAIMNQATTNPSQKRAVVQAMTEFLKQPGTQESMKKGRSWYMLVMCRSGRHRSQAWAYLLQAWLRSHGWRSRVLLGATSNTTCRAMNCVLCGQTPTVSHYLARHMAGDEQFKALPMPLRPKSKAMPRPMAIQTKARPVSCLPQSKARPRSAA